MRVGGSAHDPEFDFQAAARSSHSDQPVPLGGVSRALREAAEANGLDPISELYNEALRYANEGHLRLARERLLMLLCMAPDDGEARLLLARVHVAGQRWSEALASLDEAVGCGQVVPVSLRRTVEDHLRAEAASVDEEKTAVRAREQGETKALRQEARRLRSENATLLTRTTDLEREARKWAWATTAASAVTVIFVALNLAIGLARGPAEASPEAPLLGEAPAAAAPAAEASPPTATALAGEAAAALAAAPGLDGTNLEVEVRGASAVVRGEVTAWKQKSIASNALKAVPGVEKVDVAQVVILARTRGAVHTVASGDSLSKIAHQYYGDSTLSPKIQAANRDLLKGGNNLSVGMKLTIPPSP
jgi:nucleoid-associated protein YgaU